MPESQVRVRITGDATQFNAAIDSATGQMKKLGNTVTAIGLMQVGAAFSQIGSKVTGATSQMVSSFASIEKGMAAVNTLLGASVDAQAIFGDEVERLATTIPVTGGQLEVLQGLYQTISAGIRDTSQATHFLEIAMKAATAGMSDTRTAVDALSTIMMSYPEGAYNAEKASDILFQTINQGKTTFAELAPQLGRVTSIAAQAGISFEELSAAISASTKAGISTDMAVTGLRQTMISFLSPSEEMEKAVETLGYTSAASMLQQEGLAVSLQLLREQTGGSAEAMQGLFPNVRALTVALPLAGEQADVMAADLALMSESAGVAEEAFGLMADTTDAKMTEMNNRLEEAQARFGELLAPTQLWVEEMKVNLLETLTGINPELGKAIGGIMVLGGEFMNTMGPTMQFVGSLALLSATVGITRMQMLGLGAATAVVGFAFLAITSESDTMKAVFTAMTAAIVGLSIAYWALTASTMAWQTALTLGAGAALITAGIVGGLSILYKEQKKAMEEVSEYQMETGGYAPSYGTYTPSDISGLPTGGAGGGTGKGGYAARPYLMRDIQGKEDDIYVQTWDDVRALQLGGRYTLTLAFKDDHWANWRYLQGKPPWTSMAMGGITTGDVLARLHPNEAVIPLDKAGGMGNTYINIERGAIVVRDSENPERTAEVIMRKLQQDCSRTFKVRR